MSKSRRFISKIISAMLVISVMSGCTGNASQPAAVPTAQPAAAPAPVPVPVPMVANFNATGMPIVNDKITLSVMTVASSRVSHDDEYLFYPRMEELTNIKMNVEFVPNASRGEKLNLILATGDYPDILLKMGISKTQEMNYGDKENIFLPLEDLIRQYAPNLNQTLDSTEGLRKATTLPSGHIYSVPDKGEGGSLNHWHYNTTWLKKLGMNEPKSVDDLYNVFKAFKTKDPNGNGLNDEIPLSPVGAGQLRALSPFFGFLEVNGCTLKNNEVVFSFAMQEYYDMLEFLVKCWEEELLDHDTFTQNTQERNAKAQAELTTIGMVHYAGVRLAVGIGHQYEYESLIPWDTKNSKAMWPAPQPSTGTYLITDKCKYPEAAIRWVDYLFTKEGSMLGWMGREGEEYKMNPDGSWEWIVPEGMNVDQVRHKGGLQGTVSAPVPIPSIWNKMNDPNEAWVNVNRERVRPYDTLTMPSLYIEEESQKRVTSIWADINPYVNEFMAQVVTGKVSLRSEWDNYRSTLDKMGQKEYIELYQKAYNDYLKN